MSATFNQFIHQQNSIVIMPVIVDKREALKIAKEEAKNHLQRKWNVLVVVELIMQGLLVQGTLIVSREVRNIQGV